MLVLAATFSALLSAAVVNGCTGYVPAFDNFACSIDSERTTMLKEQGRGYKKV